MKRSEFDRAVAEEFGEVQGRVLVRQLVLDEFDGRTARAALESNVPAVSVWLALCRANGVPEARWHGRGRPVPHR